MRVLTQRVSDRRGDCLLTPAGRRYVDPVTGPSRRRWGVAKRVFIGLGLVMDLVLVMSTFANGALPPLLRRWPGAGGWSTD